MILTRLQLRASLVFAIGAGFAHVPLCRAANPPASRPAEVVHLDLEIAEMLEKAEKLTSRISFCGSRASAYEAIAQTYAHGGDAATAIRLLVQARDAINEDRVDGWKAEPLILLAWIQHRIGDADGARLTLASARETADRAEGLTIKPEALGYVAEAQRMTGDIKAGDATFDAALAAVRKKWGRVCVPSDYSENRQPDGAKRRRWAGKGNRQSTRAPIDRSSVLSDIAEIQADRGDFAGALATAMDKAVDDLHRDKALTAISKAQAKAGDNRRRRKDDTAIQRTSDANQARVELVKALAHAGDFDAARNVAGDIDKDIRHADEAKVELITAQAQAGDIATALEAVKLLSDDGSVRATAYAAIVSAQADHHDVAGTRQTITLMLVAAKRSTPKNWAIVKHAMFSAPSAPPRPRRGFGRHRASFATARQAADKLDKEDTFHGLDRYMAFSRLAETLADAGLFDESKLACEATEHRRHINISRRRWFDRENPPRQKNGLIRWNPRTQRWSLRASPRG